MGDRQRARDPEEIQARIAQAREEITRSVLVLRERVETAADWRGWVRRRPVLVLGAALGVGVWLGWHPQGGRGGRDGY